MSPTASSVSAVNAHRTVERVRANLLSDAPHVPKRDVDALAARVTRAEERARADLERRAEFVARIERLEAAIERLGGKL